MVREILEQIDTENSDVSKEKVIETVKAIQSEFRRLNDEISSLISHFKRAKEEDKELTEAKVMSRLRNIKTKLEDI
jgi:ElaB/YqjD/DUF883 family membrane-anchored ribosome-binding protein